MRALAGLAPRAPLRGQQIRPRTASGGHGLIVVGSHVSQTSRQVAALRARGATTDIELDVASVLTGPGQVVADTARQVAAALGRSDVLLYTSRTLIQGRDAADSLAIARMVSAPCPGPSGKRWPPGRPGSSPRAGSPPTTLPCTAWASAGRRWPASCFPA